MLDGECESEGELPCNSESCSGKFCILHYMDHSKHKPSDAKRIKRF